MKEQISNCICFPRYRKKSKMDDCRMQHFPAFHIPCILRPCEVLLQNMEKNCCIIKQIEAVRFCETVLHPICCVIVDYLHSRNRLLSDRERNICMVRLCVFLERIRFIELKVPSYHQIRKVYEGTGAVCEMLPMGEDGIRSDVLAQTRADVLHVTPFHSFPSGVTATIGKRYEYLEWAKTSFYCGR